MPSKWFEGPQRVLTVTVIGFFVGIVAVIVIATSTFFLLIADGLRKYIFEIVLGIGVAAFLLLAGGYLRAKYGKTKPPEVNESNPLAFFQRLDFWGAVLLSVTLPVYFFVKKPPEPPAPKPAVVARVEPPPPPPPEPEPPPPVVFPALKLKGMVLNGPYSTAVINGVTVRLNSVISNTTVVAIEPEGVTLELKGERKLLKLED